MQIKILYDNQSVYPDIKCGWGFSCLLGDNILFDTGEDAKAFEHNAKNLNVDTMRIQHVVISHDHWDHTGALWWLLEKIPEAFVYAGRNFSKDFQNQLGFTDADIIFPEGRQEIQQNIFVIGEMRGQYKKSNISEQAIVIKTNKGLFVITGCAHPGIIEVIKRIKSLFLGEPVDFVLGGFHLLHSPEEEIEKVVNEFKALGVKRVAPTHCSGDKAREIFQKVYRENYIPIGAGSVLEA
ncbi:MAG: MBL fold metallo-hydrolase [Candidatus Aceula meridiana]|nr:MBL fold metallo-hydrolase [Candidatus Aceula meridiana]